MHTYTHQLIVVVDVVAGKFACRIAYVELGRAVIVPILHFPLAFRFYIASLVSLDLWFIAAKRKRQNLAKRNHHHVCMSFAVSSTRGISSKHTLSE